MRRAYKVWLGIAAGVFVLVAATDIGATAQPTPVAASAAAPTTTTTTTLPTTTLPTTTYAPVTSSTTPTPVGETVTVTDVIDGDTLEVSGDRRVRLLGIDACDTSTRGGREAKDLLEGLVASGQVRLIADGARDRDGAGRLLRRVETTASTDLGELMVVYPTVGLAEGRDATPAYLSRLRAADTGERDCSGTPTTTSTTSSRGDVDVDIDLGDDNGLPDGALTGGYCARKWWC